ncbi:MAG: FimB/Mfa2 family fimbrial subunit [Bacteroidales bacterium]|nr:FimB/Mfa2 family fimbrial subunit [Bacteroidales bacterium]
MKKTLLTAMAALMMGAMCSCSSDNDDVHEATVTFSAQLPSAISSRTFSDGLSATVLDYAVYEDGKLISQDNTSIGSDRIARVSLKLMVSQTYDVIFWAHAENAPYKWTPEDQTVTVSYDGAKLNDDTRDAFYAKSTVTVSGNATESVTLLRPFAQINVGTTDIAEKADKTVSTTMTVNDVYTTVNLGTGAVSGLTNVTFAQTVRPNDGLTSDDDGYQTFPIGKLDEYEYLAMAYVLVGKDKQTSDISLGFWDNSTSINALSIPGAPMQRNYRTNIFGALLTTSSVGNVNVNILE